MRALVVALALVCAPSFVYATDADHETNDTVELPSLSRAPATDVTETAPMVAFGKWQGTGYGAYLAPKALDVAPDGGFDIMVHLNGAMLADKDWRESGLNAVVASIAIREVVGSAGYARLFSAPGYLDWVLTQTVKYVQKNVDSRARKVRRIGMASWSAGMGGVSQTLANKDSAARIDALVLLDSFHASYANPKTGQAFVAHPDHAAMGLGVAWVSGRSIGKHLMFAKRAALGDAVMVISSSSIKPPDYASCAESSLAVANTLELPVTEVDEPIGAMTLRARADQVDFHSRTWRGGGPHDHFDQLHLVGNLVRQFVAPRWNKFARDERLQSAL